MNLSEIVFLYACDLPADQRERERERSGGKWKSFCNEPVDFAQEQIV